MIDWVKSLFWKKELELTLIGLENAGKTTLVNSLGSGKFDSETIPTIGMNYRSFKKGKVTLNLYDLGGQKRFRESWDKYCTTSDCIIYVVDASDREKVQESKDELHQILTNKFLEGIPLLVLGNKNDIADCLNETELIEALELANFSKRKICCYSISAKNMTNLDITMKWLGDLEKRT